MRGSTVVDGDAFGKFDGVGESDFRNGLRLEGGQLWLQRRVPWTDRWIYRFFPAPAGLAGRPSCEGTPDLPFAGLQPALGSLPSVALSSAEANGDWCGQGECFPFPLPWESIGAETERAGDCRASLS